MSRERSLFKNTIIIFIGKICTQFVSFLLLPLYTGFLSTKDYGIVDLITTLVTLLLPIVTFQLDQGVFRELIDNRTNEKNKGKIISTGTFLVSFQCLIFLILFLFVSYFINNNYKFLLIFNLMACIYLTLCQQIARGFGDNTRYTIGSAISSFFTILFNILFIVCFGLGATGMLCGTILGQLIGIIYFVKTLKIFGYLSINNYSKKLKKILWKYSIPLIPNAIAWWILGASDAVIVSIILGVDMNGILAASLKFSTIIVTLYGIFNISWHESAALNINDSDVEVFVNKTINIMLKLFLSLCIGMIAVMPFVFPIMINKKYDMGYGLVPISMISALFNVLQGLVVVVFAAKKDTYSIAITSTFSAIINIVIHLILINFIGLYASVVSTLIALMLLSLYRIFSISKKYFKIKIENNTIISGIIIILVVVIFYYINNLYLNILSVLISVIYAILINNNSLNFIGNVIKNKLVCK